MSTDGDASATATLFYHLLHFISYSLFNFGKNLFNIKIYLNKYCLLLALFWLIASNSAIAQIDTLGNYFLTNFNKQYNTYLLGNLSHIDFQTKFGRFNINQNYQGTFLKLLDRSFRDDEDWSFAYSHNIFDKFSLNLNQNWLFTSDSRDIGMNQLSRLNGLLGISYTPNFNSQVQFLYGFENNNQLNLQSTGNVLNFSAYQKDYNFQDFLLNSDISFNYLNLNLGRKNQDINAHLRFERYFEDSTNLYMNFAYKKLQTNLLAYSGNDSIQPIEKRVENTFASNMFIQYQVIEPLMLGIIFDYNLINVNRDFHQPVAGIPYSAFYRDISQSNLNFQLFSKLYIGNFSESIYFKVNTINEKNNLSNKFSQNIPELTQYQNFESQRDYNDSRVNLFSQSTYKFSDNSILSGIYSISLNQYNTPSKDNYDDRDEQNQIINLQYFHKFSQILNFNLEFENTTTHYVYILSQRSALNNWNRIYRLTPRIDYNGEILEFHPQFEVLANYTAYDYELNLSSLKSFSFRQLSYKDSINYKLTKSVNIKSNVNIKYSERGVLYWKEFAETPQNAISEYFLRVILEKNYNNLHIGSGIRYYNSSQRRMGANPAEFDFKFVSTAPEVVIDYKLDNRWSVSLSGWYEFQNINKRTKNETTNLFVIVNMIF
ncbi:MAG: hypothetical protein ABFD00_04240 [Chloroherpetonaceae bacterium]